MSAESAVPPAGTAPASTSATQGIDAAATLLARGQDDLKKLMAEAMSNADPQLSQVLQRFQRELETAVKRTRQDFAQLPSVHRILESWNKAGLPPDDITFLIMDAIGLADSRNSMSHQDLADLIGMLSNAVLSISYVYSRSFEEAVQARKETAALRAQLGAVNKALEGAVGSLTKTTAAMKVTAQESYNLTVALSGHNWKGKILYGLTILACLVTGGLVTWVAMRLF